MDVLLATNFMWVLLLHTLVRRDKEWAWLWRPLLCLTVAALLFASVWELVRMMWSLGQ